MWGVGVRVLRRHLGCVRCRSCLQISRFSVRLRARDNCASYERDIVADTEINDEH